VVALFIKELPEVTILYFADGFGKKNPQWSQTASDFGDDQPLGYRQKVTRKTR
jgi:hypothetical protein